MNLELQLPNCRIAFADEESKTNYDLTIARTPHAYGFHPIVVITGEAMSGKTSLANHLAQALFGEENPYRCHVPAKSTDDEIQRLIPALLDEKYVIFDGIESFLFKSNALASLVHKPSWTFRPLGKQQVVTKQSQIELIVLVANGLPMSEDLERRARRIRLAPNLHFGAALPSL
jgi:energy-coupling factor transporter ATP-binding protein EcfA2